MARIYGSTRIERVDRATGERMETMSWDNFAILVRMIEMPEHAARIIQEVGVDGKDWITPGFIYRKIGQQSD